MKKCLIILVIFLCTENTEAQSIDQRLTLRYTLTELKQIQHESPERYAMLVHALDNGMYVTSRPAGKSEALDREIVFDLGTPKNFVEMGFEILNRNQYFPITGTDKMLVLKSEWVLLNELKNKK